MVMLVMNFCCEGRNQGGMLLEWCAKNDAIYIYAVTEAHADAYLRFFEEQEVGNVAECNAHFMFDTDLYRVGGLLKKHQIVRVVKIDVIKIAIQWSIDKRIVAGNAQV